jgi:hypothetical protein
MDIETAGGDLRKRNRGIGSNTGLVTVWGLYIIPNQFVADCALDLCLDRAGNFRLRVAFEFLNRKESHIHLYLRRSFLFLYTDLQPHLGSPLLRHQLRLG